MVETEQLTKNQVQEVISFAQNLWAAERYGMGFYSPEMSNSLLVGLNNNPKVPNMDRLVKLLSNYKANTNDLQGYMDFMSHFDMIFERTLYSYVNALSFDLSITCKDAFTKSDYESKEYQEDKKRVYDFLDKFDYKAEFRKVLMSVMKNEVYYTWFRKTKWGNKGMKYVLQILPQDRCMLTGYWEHGLLFDFDMTYFLQAGVDIDAYDPVFKKYYNKVFSENLEGYKDYRPTNQFNERNGTYAMWTQTSPTDGAWAFKFDTSSFDTVPFLAPFMKATLRNSEIEQLQYDKDMISAYGILAGEIRLFDNAKSGTVSNQFAISPDTLGLFMGKAKAGLGKIKLAALPLENTKFHQYVDNNKDMYEKQLVNSAGQGSGISRVIYSSDRMGNAELEAAMTEMYNTMKPMYYQFSNFLNFYVNQIVKKYHFDFSFEGSNYGFEREKRFEKLIKLADKGLVLASSAWASACGFKPQTFERLLEESKYSGWVDKVSQMMVNANTQSYDKGGRPQKDTGDLSDSGELNRDSDAEL